MKQFYDILDELDTTPNAFHILWCIANKRRPKSVNAHAELRNLIASKLLDDKYAITSQGKLVLEKIQSIFQESIIEVKPVVLDDFIAQYLELFPKGKLPSGKSSRVNRRDIERAFKWFFQNYDYSWDTILKATAYYVDSFEKQKFMYMRNSQYFIGKTNPDKTKDSDLASYCEIILNGGYEEDTTLSEKVV
jgi:hypothetical protein